MKLDRTAKILLGLIAALFFLNLLSHFLSSKPAMANPENGNIGRYQMSSWGAVQLAAPEVKSGYYVVDTVTGKVVQNWIEARRK